MFGECSTITIGGDVFGKPIIDERFMQKYRKHLICNRVSKCELEASFDDSASANALDKIHRVYENFNCGNDKSVQVESSKKVEVTRAEKSSGGGVFNNNVVTQKPSPTEPIAPKKDPTAVMCHIAGDPERCRLVSSSCQWKPASMSYCGIRRGQESVPTSINCRLATNEERCRLVSPACEFVQGTAGYCEAK